LLFRALRDWRGKGPAVDGVQGHSPIERLARGEPTRPPIPRGGTRLFLPGVSCDPHDSDESRRLPVTENPGRGRDQPALSRIQDRARRACVVTQSLGRQEADSIRLRRLPELRMRIPPHTEGRGRPAFRRLFPSPGPRRKPSTARALLAAFFGGINQRPSGFAGGERSLQRRRRWIAGDTVGRQFP